MLTHTLEKLAPSEKCLPWYFPAVDNSTRMCNPFEARNFGNIMKKTDSDQCKVNMNFPGKIHLDHDITLDAVLLTGLRRDPLLCERVRLALQGM